MHQDLTALSFPDESIDMVLSSDVLEHVPDPPRRTRRSAGSCGRAVATVFAVPFHQHLPWTTGVPT